MEFATPGATCVFSPKFFTDIGRAAGTCASFGLTKGPQEIIRIARPAVMLKPTPRLTSMRKLLEDTAQRAISYLKSLEARSVAPLPEAVAKLSALDEPLPEAPTPPEHVIKQLDETCSPATTAMAGPRFFGFVIGGSLPVTLAAIGSPAPGTRIRAYTLPRPLPPGLRKSPCVGCWTSSDCPQSVEVRSSLERRWQTSLR